MRRPVLLYGVYVILIIGLVVAIVAAFGRDEPKPQAPSGKPIIANTRAPKPPAPTRATTSSRTGTPQTSSTSTQTPSSTSSTAATTAATAARAATSTTTSTQKLADSGPTETLAVFSIVTIAGTVAFSQYQRRRLTS